MAGNPQVLELLEEMLDSGKTPEEVCHDCPELLPAVRRGLLDLQALHSMVESRTEASRRRLSRIRTQLPFPSDKLDRFLPIAAVPVRDRLLHTVAS